STVNLAADPWNQYAAMAVRTSPLPSCTIEHSMNFRRALVLLVVILLAAAVYAYATRTPSSLTLTGIVTTNDVIVSSQVAGQISQLLAKEGDEGKANQLTAVIAPEELAADTSYYAQNAAGLSSQVRESAAALRLEEQQTAG